MTTNSNDPVMELFHRCWGHCADSPSYDKESWKQLQRLLERQADALKAIDDEIAVQQAKPDSGVGRVMTTSRSQLVGMLAALRGIVYDLTTGFERRQVDKAPTLTDARALLDLTAIATSDEDLVDGGFDMTWRWPKDSAATTTISNADGDEKVGA